MKIGALVLTLLAGLAGPCALARAVHNHHVHRPAVEKTAMHRSGPAPQGSATKPSSDRSAVDKVDIDHAAVPLPSRDDRNSVKAPELKIVKPERSPAPHLGALVPSKPVVRNAIGQAVMPPRDMNAAGKAIQNAGSIDRGKPLAKPTTPVNLSSRGSIGGTGLIRPAQAAAVGGPPKPVSGINGTSLRPKRK